LRAPLRRGVSHEYWGIVPHAAAFSGYFSQRHTPELAVFWQLPVQQSEPVRQNALVAPQFVPPPPPPPDEGGMVHTEFTQKPKQQSSGWEQPAPSDLQLPVVLSRGGGWQEPWTQ
jgi:hypothetical protein